MGTGGGGGGCRLLASFPQGCVSVLYQDVIPKMDLNMLYRLSDLVNCFELLCDGYDVSSNYAHPGLFDRGLLPPPLFVKGTLSVAGVCIDVSGAALLWGGDSVSAVSRLMMSDDMGDGDWVTVAMTARSQTGGSGSFDWLRFVMRGAGPVAPPIIGQEHTVVLNRRGVVVYVRIVYTQPESVATLQVTGSLLLLILVCAMSPIVLQIVACYILVSIKVDPTCVYVW